MVTLLAGSFFLVLCMVFSTSTVFAGTLYNCTDNKGRSVITDKPLGKDYKCTVLERYKDPTPDERASWGREREMTAAPPAMTQSPEAEGTRQRAAGGETGGVGRTGAEQAGQPGQPGTLPGQPGGPSIRFPMPTKEPQTGGQDTIGVPPVGNRTEGVSQGGSGTEGAPPATPPQQPWGRSRYGYYPIPLPQAPQPQQEQQQ
jgi:hypothetical protein